MGKNLFTHMVQIGSVAFVNYGKNYGKLVVIVDILDANRAIVSDPKGTMDRKTISLGWLQLTKYRVTIDRGQRLPTLKKAFDKAEVAKKFAESSWGKKIARHEKRSSLTDFDRFSVHLKKRATNLKLRKVVFKARHAQNSSLNAKKKVQFQVIPRKMRVF